MSVDRTKTLSVGGYSGYCRDSLGLNFLDRTKGDNLDKFLHCDYGQGYDFSYSNINEVGLEPFCSKRYTNKNKKEGGTAWRKAS